MNYLTLSNSLIITPSLLFQSKLPQHLLELKDFAILCEKFIIALHISLPIVQGEQNFIHISYFLFEAFHPPPTSPQVMPTEKKLQ